MTWRPREEIISYKRSAGTQGHSDGRVVLRSHVSFEKEDGLPYEYFQFRIFSGSHKPNPRIFIGLCTEDFKCNKELPKPPDTKHGDLWCINLAIGDVFSDKKWRPYIEISEEDKKIN